MDPTLIGICANSSETGSLNHTDFRNRGFCDPFPGGLAHRVVRTVCRGHPFPKTDHHSRTHFPGLPGFNQTCQPHENTARQDEDAHFNDHLGVRCRRHDADRVVGTSGSGEKRSKRVDFLQRHQTLGSCRRSHPDRRDRMWGSVREKP